MNYCMVCGKPVSEAWRTQGTTITNAHKECFAEAATVPHDWREDMESVNAWREDWWEPVPMEETTENGEWTGWKEYTRYYERVRKQLQNVRDHEIVASDLYEGCQMDNWGEDEKFETEHDWAREISASFEIRQSWSAAKILKLFEENYKVNSPDKKYQKRNPLTGDIETYTAKSEKLSLSTVKRVIVIVKEDLEDVRRRDEAEDFIWWADKRVKYLQEHQKRVLETGNVRLSARIDKQIELYRKQKDQDLEHYRRRKLYEQTLEQELKLQKALIDAELRMAEMKEKEGKRNAKRSTGHSTKQNTKLDRGSTRRDNARNHRTGGQASYYAVQSAD